MPLDGFLFIVTYGRSGSTMLQNLVNSIPGYEIRGENNNALYHLSRSYWAIVDSEPMAALRRSGGVSEQTHPWFGAEKAFPKAYGRMLAQTFVRSILKPSEGTRVSGFKEIRFHNHPEDFRAYLDFIAEYFPNARFLFNTRDHGSVAKSGWWAKHNPAHVDRVLTEAEALFDDYIARSPHRCFRLHYDDYVGRPEAMRPLFRFLGEPFDLDVVSKVMEQRLDHLQKQRKD